MGYDNWDRAIEIGTFREDCRQRRKNQGYDPDIKPSHRWLSSNGFSGIQNVARRKGMTVDELLIEEVGFEKPSYEYQIEDDRTRSHVKTFIDDESDDYGRYSETTVKSIKSHFKKIAKASRQARGTDDLVAIAEKPKSVAYRLLKKVLSELETMIGVGIINYARTLSEFISHLDQVGAIDIDKNPVKLIVDRKGYTAYPDRPDVGDIPDPEEIHLAYSKADPMLTAGIVLTAGSGSRPTHVVSKTADDINLDPADPHVKVKRENKTGPTNRALMGGIEFMENYIEAVSTEQTSDSIYIFPSDKGQKPHMSYGNFLEKFKRHCRKLELTDSDGDPYTPKLFKSFYVTRLTELSIRYENKHVGRATEYIGDKSSKVKKESYSYQRLERDHFRQHVEDTYRRVFQDDAVSVQDIKKERSLRHREDNQSSLYDFS